MVAGQLHPLPRLRFHRGPHNIEDAGRIRAAMDEITHLHNGQIRRQLQGVFVCAKRDEGLPERPGLTADVAKERDPAALRRNLGIASRWQCITCRSAESLRQHRV